MRRWLEVCPTHDSDIVDGNVSIFGKASECSQEAEGMSGARGCQLLLNHGRKVICSGDEEHYDYLIKREALIAQQKIRSEIGVGLQTVEEGTARVSGADQSTTSMATMPWGTEPRACHWEAQSSPGEAAQADC